jgi:hypothetical protein
MMAELSALEDKFDAWVSEGTPEEVSNIMKKQVGHKASRVSQRLYSAGRAGRASSMNPDQAPATPIDSERSKYADPAALVKEEIDKIDLKLVNNGGVNCGWDGADHKDFLRIRMKYSQKNVSMAFVNELRRTIANCDDFECRAHIAAYNKYLELIEEKKELIQKYKEAREQMKVAKMTRLNGSSY